MEQTSEIRKHNDIFEEEIKMFLTMLILNLFKPRISKQYPHWQELRIHWEGMVFTEFTVLADDKKHQLPLEWLQDLSTLATSAIKVFHYGRSSLAIPNNSL